MADKSKTKSQNETIESGLEELDESLHPFVNKGKNESKEEEESQVDDEYGVDLTGGKDELEDEEEESETEESEDEESQEDEEESEETDDDLEDGDNESDDESKDTVPLKTYLKEKQKNKAFQKRLDAIEAKVNESETSNLKNQLLKKYEEDGHDTDLVSKLLDDVLEITGTKSKRDTSERIIDEIEELAEDDLFSDAVDYTDKIVKRISDFKKAGVKLSVEDAYLSVVGKSKIKSKIKDQSVRDKATKRINAKKTSTKKSNPEMDRGHKKANTYGLSKKDLKNLQKLKKLQPNSGWTPQKYAQYTTRNET